MKELSEVVQRIAEMRSLLKQKLITLNTPGNWDHLTNQIGMFSYTGLNPKQVDILTEKFHIYLTKNGRISLSGIS